MTKIVHFIGIPKPSNFFQALLFHVLRLFFPTVGLLFPEDSLILQTNSRIPK